MNSIFKTREWKTFQGRTRLTSHFNRFKDVIPLLFTRVWLKRQRQRDRNTLVPIDRRLHFTRGPMQRGGVVVVPVSDLQCFHISNEDFQSSYCSRLHTSGREDHPSAARTRSPCIVGQRHAVDLKGHRGTPAAPALCPIQSTRRGTSFTRCPTAKDAKGGEHYSSPARVCDRRC